VQSEVSGMKIGKYLRMQLAALLLVGMSGAASADIIVAITDDGLGGTLLTFSGGTGVTSGAGTAQDRGATTLLPGGLFFGTAATGGFVGFDINAGNAGFFRNGVSGNLDALQLGFNSGTPVAGTQVSELDGATLTIGGLLFTTSSNLIGTIFDTHLNGLDIGDIIFSSEVAISEPGSLALIFSMLGGLVLLRRRYAKAPA
jgi:hypothetical protein